MTFPAHDHARRRELIRALLPSLEVDALLVTHGVDVRWLTGVVASNAQVVIAADPDLDALWTDNRYAEPARASQMVVRLDPWIEDLGAHVAGLSSIGVQAEHVTIRTHEALLASVTGTVVATTRVLGDARRVKDEAELARLEVACALTDAGWQWLVGHVEPGMTERALARDLIRHLEDLGAEGPAFAPIVAAGPNSAVPHHQPTDRALGTGEVLKVDFGARVEGYHADCTRVLSIGEPPAVLRQVHAHVLQAQVAGVAAAVVGASAEDVHEASVGWLDGLDIGPTLHGVGHGVGLEIHESPILSSEPAATLTSGFVVTVEPGIYLSGLGGVRIEDTVAVTAAGPRRLTACARDLAVL